MRGGMCVSGRACAREGMRACVDGKRVCARACACACLSVVGSFSRMARATVLALPAVALRGGWPGGSGRGAAESVSAAACTEEKRKPCRDESSCAACAARRCPSGCTPGAWHAEAHERRRREQQRGSAGGGAAQRGAARRNKRGAKTSAERRGAQRGARETDAAGGRACTPPAPRCGARRAHRESASRRRREARGAPPLLQRQHLLPFRCFACRGRAPLCASRARPGALPRAACAC
jgi:hypothetical protein